MENISERYIVVFQTLICLYIFIYICIYLQDTAYYIDHIKSCSWGIFVKTCGSVTCKHILI